MALEKMYCASGVMQCYMAVAIYLTLHCGQCSCVLEQFGFTVTILGAFVASYFRQVAIYAGLRVRVAGAFAASKGGYGYRRIRPAFRTRVSEKVLRGIMAEDGLTAHVPERRGYGSYEGGKTLPAPGNLADRDFTAGMPNGKRPADITTGSRPGTGRACLSPPVD